MLVFFARSGSRHPVIPAALGLLIGGSVSNLVDRVRLGHVTDFLDLGWWPAFNLADTFIVLGVTILLVALVAGDRPPERPKRQLDVAALSRARTRRRRTRDDSAAEPRAHEPPPPRAKRARLGLRGVPHPGVGISRSAAADATGGARRYV